MTSPAVHLVHALERRVRMRAPALAGHRSVCERIAEQLAADPACEVVSVRPITGSVIVERTVGGLEPERLRALLAGLVEEACDDDGHRIAAPRPEGHPGPTRVARAVAHAFAAINADVREAMDYRADLGTILPVVFAVGGLVEVGATRRLPVPAWFNLLWWSLRWFMTFNPGAVSEELRGGGGPQDQPGVAGEGAGEEAPPCDDL
ncbi:HMA2 domain-containing protein [Sorangium sp. So ce1000]|uniref:HMA2 domain-containing protein n=1 Tax=Sorangium sp. So ce1000 TaxID=3133325 RepID=UPI003F628F13